MRLEEEVLDIRIQVHCFDKVHQEMFRKHRRQYPVCSLHYLSP